MFINELAEPTLLVIYPGRFQPFHKGHHQVFEWLCGKFGRNNVYIATSNKTDNLKSPFSFAEKAYFMQLTGVPADRIIQATQPYQITNVLQSGHINVANPANTVVIFAVSEKDMAEDPRFSFAPKKDGSQPYFQPLKDIKQTESMEKHGYILTVPTFDFTVAGAPMRSGTELRKLYAGADEKQRQEIIAELFGRYTREAEQIMQKIVPAEPVKEPKLGNRAELKKAKLPKPEPVAETVSAFVPANKDSMGSAERDYYNFIQLKAKLGRTLTKNEKEFVQLMALRQKMQEDAAGVGVVKNSKDPRYVMATMGDQNDVTGETPKKNLRAFKLAENEREPYQQAIDRLSQSRMDQLNSLIDEIMHRITTEKLPAHYVDALKQRLEKLKAERVNVALGR